MKRDKIYKEIVFIEPTSLAKIIAALCFVCSLLLMVPELFFFFRGQPASYWHGENLGFGVLTLLRDTVLGYISGILVAYAYNFFSRKIGGIEIALIET